MLKVEEDVATSRFLERNATTGHFEKARYQCPKETGKVFALGEK